MAGGIRFGQYVLLRRIARGGMAEVFLAQQQGLEGFDRRVAVKRILPHLADSPDFVKMFLGEAKLAAQLSHPNVVHIYDFGKVGGDYFIAMEYVEGVHAGQLWHLAETGGPAGRLAPALVARIGADAAAALHHAHELRGSSGRPLGLVHRDVSPANLMVSFDGVVKLCDFGIAKAAALSDQLTNPGQVKGKYAYMSPEQTIAAPLDGRSDVFSLAIVLWELLTGKTIVGRGDAVDAMRAIRDGKLEPLSSAAPATPPPLAKAIGWALETKRDRRATAAELAQALEAFIKSSPDLATPMQLGAWVRARFPRDATGESDVISAGSGTAAVGGDSPGTAAAPSTMAGPPTVAPARGAQAAPLALAARGATAGPPTAAVRPMEALIAASRLPAHGGAGDDDELDALEGAETVALERHELPARAATPSPKAPTPSPRAPLPAPQTPPGGRAYGRSARAAPQDPTAQLDLSDLEETGDRGDPADRPQPDGAIEETTERKNARRPFVNAAAAAAPTLFEVPSLVRGTASPVLPPPPAERSARAAASAKRPSSRRRLDATARVPRRGARIAVSVGVLLAIGVLSFLLALAARSRSHGATPADAAAPGSDASGFSVLPLPVDAPPPPPPPDAALPPLPDAAPTAALPAGDAGVEGILDVTTTPTGATVRVGDQARTAPAKLALPAGHYVVIAELKGYAAERREVDIERNEHVAQEIAFTHRLASAHGPERPPTAAFGRLTVKTTPYSEVFTSAGNSLGQTPLADIELPAGSHLLTFKNPTHPDSTRRVTITAGKTTKLQFSLP